MICLKCQSCHYEYTISEAELRDNGAWHRDCFICGGIVEVINLEEIVKKDIDTEIKENVDNYILMLGIEGAWELIERNKSQACARLYFEEFKRRGINLKGERNDKI